MFDAFGVPFDMAKVFDATKDIFDAFPLTIRIMFVGCFSIACLFAIIRMLT